LGQIGKRLSRQGQIPAVLFKLHRLNPRKWKRRLKTCVVWDLQLSETLPLPAQGCGYGPYPFDRALVDHYYFPKIIEEWHLQLPMLPIFVPLIRKESEKYTPTPTYSHLYQQFDDRL
jgi:hypothetical protein